MIIVIMYVVVLYNIYYIIYVVQYILIRINIYCIMLIYNINTMIIYINNTLKYVNVK